MVYTLPLVGSSVATTELGILDSKVFITGSLTNRSSLPLLSAYFTQKSNNKIVKSEAWDENK
jgi:hypothetical protein